MSCFFRLRVLRWELAFCAGVGLLMIFSNLLRAEDAAPATALAPSIITVPPRPQPVVLESPYYEVAAPDYASAQSVMQLTRRMQTLLAKYFTWPKQQVRTIQVQLVPVTQADFAASFNITTEREGQRIALVRWGPEATLSDTCLAISSASLERLAYWGKGPAAAARVPDWLKIAFGKMLEADVKIAVVDDFVEQASRLPVLSLRQIMTAHGPYEDALPVLAVNAYWLARFLGEEAGDNDADRALFGALASGADPVDTLRAAFPGKFADAKSLELWWKVGYQDMIARRAPIVQTMAQTRAMLDRFQQVTVKHEGRDRRLQLDDAWAERASPGLREAIAATLLAAREWPFQSNPVYKNSLVSLLLALDQLRGDDEVAFKKTWAQYQTDRAAAEVIENSVNAALP